MADRTAPVGEMPSRPAKAHRTRKTGRKAEKKALADKKRRGLTTERHNWKAFLPTSSRAAMKRSQRNLDREHKKLHRPLVDRTPDEPPPIIVVVMGPPGVGKSTLIRSMVKHYTKHSMTSVLGPVTVVAGKNRRLTFYECPNEINAMIDLAKIADLVLLMVDASFGFEMETFEFLNVLQTHGFPKVMGVLTHLDRIRSSKTLQRTKKKLKHRFWTEIYQGAKLFYLSGLIYGRYAKNEVHNLARFISVIKFRPLIWRNSHSYVLVDRVEDITNPQAVAEDVAVDRRVVLYGWVRGTNLKASTRVHIPGCGDFGLSDVSLLDDPCPLPSKERKRTLNQRERLLYAPMADAGQISYDRDAVYITISDHKVAFTDKSEFLDAATNKPVLTGSGGDGGGGGDPGDGAGAVGANGERRTTAADGAGVGMVKELQKTNVGIDEALQAAPLQLFSGTFVSAADIAKQERVRRPANFDADDDADDDAGDHGGDNKASRRRRGLRGDGGSSSSSGDSLGSDDADELEAAARAAREQSPGSGGGSGSAASSSASSSDGGIGGGGGGLRWKEDLAAKAEATFQAAAARNVMKLVYGDESESYYSDESGGGGGGGGGGFGGGGSSSGSGSSDFFRPVTRTRKEKHLALFDADAEGAQIDFLDSTRVPRHGSTSRSDEWVAALKARFTSADDFDDNDDDGGDNGLNGMFDLDNDDSDVSDGDDEVIGDSDDGMGLDAAALRREKLKKRSMFDATNGRSGGGAGGPGGDANDDGDGGWSNSGGGSDGGDDDDESKLNFYEQQKRAQEEQKRRNREAFEDDEARIRYQGFNAGMYVRVVIEGMPAEFVERRAVDAPILLGGLKPEEETLGFIKTRVKKHRWHKKILKSNDPLVFSLGWRRFQSLPLFSINNNGRNRFLKYTPEHMHCWATFWGPQTPPNTGLIAFQALGGQASFRAALSGVVLELDQTFQVQKKLKLTGVPVKIFKNTSFIKDMFSSALEVARFEGASIRTVSGIRGQIKKTQKHNYPPGTFRATFEDKILMSDIVFIRTWYAIEPKKFYNPVASLLVGGGVGLGASGAAAAADTAASAAAAADGQGGAAEPGGALDKLLMRTQGRLRFEAGEKVKLNKDSLYGPAVRKVHNFAPLRIPRKLEANLPFAAKQAAAADGRRAETKTATVTKRERRRAKKTLLAGRGRMVMLEPDEQARADLLATITTIKSEKEAKREAARAKSFAAFEQRKEAEAAADEAAIRIKRKRRMAAAGRASKRQKL